MYFRFLSKKALFGSRALNHSGSRVFVVKDHDGAVDKSMAFEVGSANGSDLTHNNLNCAILLSKPLVYLFFKFFKSITSCPGENFYFFHLFFPPFLENIIYFVYYRNPMGFLAVCQGNKKPAR
jgi:hypothetical protein